MLHAAYTDPGFIKIMGGFINVLKISVTLEPECSLFRDKFRVLSLFFLSFFLFLMSYVAALFKWGTSSYSFAVVTQFCQLWAFHC